MRSDWIDGQIRRASTKVSQLSIDRLYPRVIPRSTYLSVVLIGLVIGLNFLPLPSNHNWVYLQAAPNFSLTDAERTFLAQAQALLKKTDALNKTDLAARIEQIIKDLQEGRIDTAEAVKQLEEIQKLLDSPAVDTAAAAKKLSEMAEDLKNSKELKEAAEAVQEKDLEDAAEKMKKAAEDMEATAEGLKDQDPNAAAKALQGAVYLKELADKLQDQEVKDQAAKELQSLAQSLQQRGTPSQQTAKSEEVKEPGESNGELQSGEESSSDDANAQTSNDSDSGAAQTPRDSGGPKEDAPREGPPTQKLDVQLQQEQLTGQYDQEASPEEIERNSRQERSKLDYRSVPTQLSAAERDVLSQKQIPWEYRSLIKHTSRQYSPAKKNDRLKSTGSP